MAGVAVLFADGFEEIEAVTIVDVLRRAAIETSIVGVGGSSIRGAHGITVEADVELAAAREVSWEMVVLPGGIPGATNLRDNQSVQSFLKEQAAGGVRLGAICAAPIALAAAGALEGRRATSYPGFAEELRGVEYVEEPVVKDTDARGAVVITSRGVGTALDFALSLVEELRDAETAAALAERMLVARR